jgi:hypothetical protein
VDNYEERRDRPVFSLTYEKVGSGHEVRERGHVMAVDVHDVVGVVLKASTLCLKYTYWKVEILH